MKTNTTYMGLPLKSPIIIGSCGLTYQIDNIKKMEEYGAGAIVLKSLFEEQIAIEVNRIEKTVSDYSNYGESFEYIANHISGNEVDKYLSLIKEAKKCVQIPIIGSINCFTFDKWLYFAKKMEDAGADAIELNINFLPVNINQSAEDIEQLFSDIISTLKKSINIPISIKCGFYFTDMAKFMQRISWMGISGLTLFNKEFKFDIDVEKMVYKPASIFSSKEEIYNTIRWVGILKSVVRCNISATTGVQNGLDVVKLLLAGATTVQIASSLYKNNISYIETITKELQEWMTDHHFESIDEFRGKMSLKETKNPEDLFRIQFIKHYSGIE